jgi:hypothetical protein
MPVYATRHPPSRLSLVPWGVLHSVVRAVARWWPASRPAPVPPPRPKQLRSLARCWTGRSPRSRWRTELWPRAESPGRCRVPSPRRAGSLCPSLWCGPWPRRPVVQWSHSDRSVCAGGWLVGSGRHRGHGRGRRRLRGLAGLTSVRLSALVRRRAWTCRDLRCDKIGPFPAHSEPTRRVPGSGGASGQTWAGSRPVVASRTSRAGRSPASVKPDGAGRTVHITDDAAGPGSVGPLAPQCVPLHQP